MKTDDPKFTAFALDELDAAERSEIEMLLRDDPALSAEIAELRRFAANLRRELHAEEGAPLAEDQRAAVLGAEPRIIAMPRPWWRRPWVQSAAAACVIVGVSAVMLSEIEMRKPQIGERGDIALEPARIAEPAMEESLPNPTDPVTVLVTEELAKEPQPVAAPAAPAMPAQTSALDSPGAVELRPEIVVRGLAPQAPAEAAVSERKRIRVIADNSRPEALAEITASLPAPAAAAPMTTVLDVQQHDLAATASAPSKAPKRQAPSADPRKASAAAKPAAPAPRPSVAVTSARPTEFYADVAKPETLNRRLAIARTQSLSAVDSFDTSKTVEEFGVELREGSVPPREAYRYRHIERELASNNTEAYDSITDNAFLPVKDQPLSTFSIDVDTASYTNVRRFLNANQRPPKGAVRIEELVNYFRYEYPQPDGPDPFSCALEVATCPWQTEHRLVRIGLKGKEIKREARPEANLVFLVDVSGSMAPENKLPLVRSSLKLLVDQLNADDSVAIAVYAGASGCVLEPTSDKAKMREALSRLEAGGSTNGAAGIQLAYDLAQRSFKKGGTNRVILCTDGDFNVGVTSQSELISLIQRKAKGGVFLSVLGFGMGNLKDSTLEKLADNGNGNYAYIDTLNEGRRVFVEQMSGTLITIAKDVKVQVEFNPAQVSAYRLIGYENRLLAKEDFNDDAKDAGEIGAGHTVTALYQIVPVGKALPQQAPGIDDLKYQNAPRRAEAPPSEPPAIRAPASSEMLTVKLRYKQPESDVSKKIEFPLSDNRTTWEQSSRDFRWAASVAGFGLLLRDSPHKGSASWALVEELAAEGKGDDRDGYRAEFVGLVEKAKALSR